MMLSDLIIKSARVEICQFTSQIHNNRSTFLAINLRKIFRNSIIYIQLLIWTIIKILSYLICTNY